MRKLILGIIAVICLDVAFIVYPGIRQPGRIAYPTVNYEARNVAAIADQRASDEIAAVSDGPLSEELVQTIDRKVSIAHVRPNVGNIDRASERLTNERRLSNQQALFKPTVIVIGRASPTSGSFDRQPDSSERLKKDGPDDRSFVSTMMPIVKKPYELIRFIGAKLR